MCVRHRTVPPRTTRTHRRRGARTRLRVLEPSPHDPRSLVSDPRTPLLKVRDLSVTFGTKRHPVSAVAGISFDVYEGETLGLVGESGCGKSTTGKAIMRIVEPTGGTVELEGRDITTEKGRALRQLRTRLQ
ncbi:MAG: ATP-binding cassette domain-containing protein, partial [Acidobacteriota bacterium]|nr:ATP-binding cassette domain-containing protein [Acidobacteriota bacterium]